MSEVMINGTEVWVERGGALARAGLRLDPAEVQSLIEGIVGPAGARVDRASPIVDVRLADGSRVSIVVPPVALDGPCVAIRRFVLRRAVLEDFASPEVAALLAAAVRQRVNMVVSGGTGSGKTTLLNALAAHVSHHERIVTIEDTAELRLGHPHVVRLEARPPNTEGVGEVTVRALVKAALRLRPDRILVGEARGAEVMDVLQAMNSGHAGSMSTCHANSPRDALRRLEALALLGGSDLSGSSLPGAFVRDQLIGAVQLLVQVRRSTGHARQVTDVVVLGDGADWVSGEGLRPLVSHGRPVPGSRSPWPELLGAMPGRAA
ncbi:MAG: CpaF family protein [Acidimicrobiales bacterium]